MTGRNRIIPPGEHRPRVSNVVHACNRTERLERTPANAAKALEKPSSDRMALNPPGAHPLTERL
jgi:hypothetical protein